jgi:hypothetical protein
MLTMHIAEDEPLTHGPANASSANGLAACLAHHGVSPSVIQIALASLAQVKAVMLCRQTEVDAWEIADTHMG